MRFETSCTNFRANLIPSTFQCEFSLNIFKNCPGAKAIALDSVWELQNRKPCFMLL